MLGVALFPINAVLTIMLTYAPIRHCVMALCFIAAGLLVSAEWRSRQTTATEVQLWRHSNVDHLEFILAHSPVSAMVNPTRIVIRLDRRELQLYEGDTLVKTFPVAIGQDEWETPVGHFAVFDLRRDPVWQHPITREAVGPGPDNPLGSRWVGFALAEGEYKVGIHGTYAEELVGQAVSHGCVRMRNADIQYLFDRLSIGTPITVSPGSGCNPRN
ncbi:MAG: L,D-transpeptidase [Leptolyngbya sp.]|nr:L,D-transpeptidase [Leptolyngbya sp.]